MTIVQMQNVLYTHYKTEALDGYDVIDLGSILAEAIKAKYNESKGPEDILSKIMKVVEMYPGEEELEFADDFISIVYWNHFLKDLVKCPGIISKYSLKVDEHDINYFRILAKGFDLMMADADTDNKLNLLNSLMEVVLGGDLDYVIDQFSYIKNV